MCRVTDGLVHLHYPEICIFHPDVRITGALCSTTSREGCMLSRIAGRLGSVLIAAVMASSLLTGTVLADNDKLKAKPFTFDPNNQCDDQAEWRAKIGLADAGSSNHGLFLRKGCATTVVAAAGAVIDGADGEAAGTQFGFDIR